MDWSRAKTILIYVFLLLNIVLLVFTGSYWRDKNVTKQMILNTTHIMESRGVELECEIPLYNEKSPWLIFEDGGLDREKLVKMLLEGEEFSEEQINNEGVLSKGERRLTFLGRNWFKFTDDNPLDHSSVHISDGKRAEKYVKTFLSDLGIYSPAYDIDGIYTGTDESLTFHYIEKKNDYLIFDNFALVTLSGGGISALEYKQRKIRGFSTDSLPVLPAYKILLKNFTVDSNLTITAIDIGFKGYSTDQEIREYSEAPAWRITIKDGPPMFFKASDGEKIK